MSTRQPSPGAQRLISKLVVNLIDGPEVPIQRAQTDALFATLDGPLGLVNPDGSMVFDESVGRALERAAEPGRLSDQEVADFRRAIQVVAFTALNKRVEGYDIVIDAENDTDQFVNLGMREAYWAVHGQRIAYNLSPELGSRLLDVKDSPDHPVAREAALALANQYAKGHHELPDRAVRALLRVPRDQVFEKVVDATLTYHLYDKFEPAREALSELRGRLANELRTGFAELSRDGSVGTAEVQARVAAMCEPIDAQARTVKETLTAVRSQQAGRSSVSSARDHGRSAAKPRDRRTGFESQV
jgi:hypothetical protein